MKRYRSIIIFICVFCLALLCAGCGNGQVGKEPDDPPQESQSSIPAADTPTPAEEESPPLTKAPDKAPEAEESAPETTPAASAPTPEPAPDLPVEQIQPLLNEVAVALSSFNVTDFDAARGSEADRYFADVLLYDVVNYEQYDSDIIKVDYNDETGLCSMSTESMKLLLKGYIGDYPALLEPPSDGFFTLVDGAYEFGYSDIGDVSYSLTITQSKYLGEDIYEATGKWQEVIYGDDTANDNSARSKTVTLWFAKQPDAVCGFTVIYCAPAE